MTSRRLVLLFFLLALVTWECLEVRCVLLSLSCRHCGRLGVLLVLNLMERKIDGKGGEKVGGEVEVERGKLWERAEARKKGQ